MIIDVAIPDDAKLQDFTGWKYHGLKRENGKIWKMFSNWCSWRCNERFGKVGSQIWHSDKSKDYSISNKKIVKEVLELKGERYSWYIFSGSNNRDNIRKQHHLEKNTILTEVKMIIISNIILEKTNLELQQIHKYKYRKTK